MQMMERWSAALPGGPGRPFVTYYDTSTGERTELSGTTLANWIAKSAHLLIDELDADVGTRIQIELPIHWLRTVWILATWAVGGIVTDAPGQVRVCGPNGLDSDAPARHRVAAALLPFGMPFPSPPADHLDLGVVLPGQPDAWIPADEPEPNDLAVDLTEFALTYAELATAVSPSSERLLLEPADLDRDVRSTLAALLGGGSLVLVNSAGGPATPADVERIADQEQARIG